MRLNLRPIGAVLAAAGLLAGFAGTAAAQTVVVYTALDEMYSRPILESFEEETGIRVLASYDTEAAKTTGLVNRLIAEARRPRADVFWNNEASQTVLLKQRDVLTPYASPNAEALPDSMKDPEHYWTGFAARARVIIYNTEMVEHPPKSVLDFTKPEWRGRATIAKPLFGTTATHAGALFALWGPERAKEFFLDMKENDVAVLPGNAQVRDMVARGEYAIGLTDMDDANGAVEDGFPAKWLFPDQGEDQMGTLVIPNTVALIKDGPNPEAGKKLIDYLLSPEVEARLARMRSIQIPLNPAVEAPENVPNLSNIKAIDLSPEEIAEEMPESAQFIQDTYLR